MNRQTIRKVLRALTVVATIEAAGLLLAAHLLSVQDTTPAQTSAPESAYNAALTVLTTHHLCWTGDRPAWAPDTLPPGVIITRPGHTSPTWSSDPTDVSHALDRVFHGDHANLTVHAFCAN